MVLGSCPFRKRRGGMADEDDNVLVLSRLEVEVVNVDARET